MNPFLPLPRRAAVPTPKKFVSITHKASRAPLCQVLPICLWSSESGRFAWEDGQPLGTLRCGCSPLVEAPVWSPSPGCCRGEYSRETQNIPICPRHVVMGALPDRFACQSSSAMLMTRCSMPMTRSATPRISPNRLVGDVVQNLAEPTHFQQEKVKFIIN